MTTGRRTPPIVAASLLSGAMLLLGREPSAAQIFAPGPNPSPTATTLVARMGLPMSGAAARHGIAFVPFTPARTIIATALIPPFHGDDTRANRGIAFEYLDAAGHAYALAEWRANGGTITNFAPRAQPDGDCGSGRTFPRGTRPNGIVWSTSDGLVMTLQADGANDARTLDSEWKKLIRRGACR